MSLQDKVMAEMKAAMKAKDSTKLEALRAVKSAILMANTESSSKDGLTEDEENKLLQKLVKQRKDSAQIYKEQGREDLAEPELQQAEVIEQFLPEQMSEAEIETEVEKIIAETGASGMQDMGKVMGLASGKIAGKADGKTISTIVRKKLS
ncbi:MAG: GatB/YqeY domain-containing protein [Gramella sp.]|nr:GatB/YqeY domain-containing protein [Christiangramia sp.]